MKTEASEYLSLLQEIQNNNVSTFTVMPADEPRFTIETNSRNIIVPSEFSFLSVQNDHRAETIYFEIDRYFDNVDLSQHACVVQFINKSGTTINEGTYPVTSMDIDSVDGKIVFGWEIRNDATQLTGDITFSVRFYSIDNNGNFTYNFNTLTASSYILPSLNIIASGERITATELEVWTDKMNNLASSIESDIITVEEKIEELENYIASIPEDYTALTEEVGKLSEDIAEIKENGTGGGVDKETITEAVNNYLDENPVQAGATTEQANQIESNKQDIAILKEQVEDLSDRENSVSEAMVQSIVEEYMDENSQAMATLTINGQTFDGSQDVNIKLDTPEVPKMEKLTFTGAVDAEYDGSTPITVNIPNGSSDGSGYTLPVATSEKLGGVKPVAKDDTMTQEVGVDSEGKLYTAPNTSSGESSNGLGEPLVIETITFDEATQVIYKELDYSLYKCVYFTITQATNGTHGIYIGLRTDGLANFISLGKIYNAGTGFVYPLSKKSAFCSWNTSKGAVTGISADGNNAEGVAVFSADITGIKFVNNDNWQVGDVITIYGVKR